MEIGKNIRISRTARHLTQQALAEKLGVTATAVSKWESSKTSPDISLLSPLARALHTTVDNLLGFHENLPQEQVHIIEEKLQKKFSEIPFAGALQAWDDTLHKYPEDDNLKLRLCYLLYRNIPGEERGEQLLPKLISLLEDVTGASESYIRETALSLLAAIYLSLDEFDKALACADTLPKTFADPDGLRANIYRAKGENEKAEKMLQGLFYNDLHRAYMRLISLAGNSKKQGRSARAKAIYQRCEDLAALFSLQETLFHSGALLFMAELAAQEGKWEESLSYLQRWANTYTRPDPLSSGDICLDTVQLDASPITPAMRRGVAEEFLRNPAFASIQDNPRFKAIYKSLLAEV